jgi:CRISPR-associated endonuclease/helicase Cas3
MVERLAVQNAAPQPAWVVDARGELSVSTTGGLADLGFGDLAGKTIVLPPAAGGLRSGILDGKALHHPSIQYDVADVFPGESRPRRYRFTYRYRREGPTADDGEPIGQGAWEHVGYWPSDRGDIPYPEDEGTSRHLGCARLPELLLPRGEHEGAPQGEDEGAPLLVAFVRPDSADDETRSLFARGEQGLREHLDAAEEIAAALAAKLLPAGYLREAVRLAANYHDLGKDRKRWQNGIGNSDYPGKVLAKSGNDRRIKGLEGYRHEFGSLMDARDVLGNVGDDVRDLVLHLIAAHHGRGRPHFDEAEAFDPKPPRVRQGDTARVAAEVPRRFARLQRRFGRWGLAYLESLLRAADYAASAKPSKMAESQLCGTPSRPSASTSIRPTPASSSPTAGYWSWPIGSGARPKGGLRMGSSTSQAAEHWGPSFTPSWPTIRKKSRNSRTA